MATKTISLAEDAYKKLKKMKNDKESFSDVVRRLTSGISIADYHGVLSEETAEELDANIRERREKHKKQRAKRIEKIEEKLNDT